MTRLLVIGSVNYDLIFSHERLPVAGETVVGARLVESCGGKGANQAVAAARCARDRDRFPIEVTFVGAVGDDAFGAAQRRVFDGDGMDTSFLQVLPDIHTGTSSIWVETDTGQNRILNSPGANLRLSPEMIEAAPVEDASLLLLQNEIPAAALKAAVERAVRAEVPVIWNPAPFVAGESVPIAPDCLRFVTPNEIEAAALLAAAVDIEEPLHAVRALQALGYPGVVLTLGALGVAVGDGDDYYAIAAPAVEAVDTTGAGDAFNGAFAAALVAGQPVRAAAEFAVTYASASVGARGTQAALPYELPG